MSLFERGTNSGLWLVAPDPDAALTVPSSGVATQPVGTGVHEALVRNNAVLLGKLTLVRLGECSSGPEAAAVVTKKSLWVLRMVRAEVRF